MCANIGLGASDLVKRRFGGRAGQSFCYIFDVIPKSMTKIRRFKAIFSVLVYMSTEKFLIGIASYFQSRLVRHEGIAPIVIRLP